MFTENQPQEKLLWYIRYLVNKYQCGIVFWLSLLGCLLFFQSAIAAGSVLASAGQKKRLCPSN